MKKEFYKEIKHHYIYAIMDLIEECVFVGKTCAKDPRSKYRAHLRGEIQMTKDDFEQGETEGVLSFRVLESLDCTEAEAYKHLLAWGHFFEENGCALIMAPKSAAACDDFLPETEEIYKKVCALVTLEEVWRRRVPIEKEVEQIQEYPLKQMNIRLREDVMSWFRDFCQEEHLTQSEGLHQLLLARQEQLKSRQEDMFVRELRRKNREIQKLKAENNRLKQLKTDKGDAARKQRDCWIEMIRQMLAILFADKKGGDVLREPIPEYRYFKAKRSLALRDYLYPKSSGSCIIILEMFVRGDGKHAPLFIFGHTPEGEKMKLRWYPKPEQVGIYPRSDRYAYEGAEWLVGYIEAKDGAMDLLAVVPLDKFKIDATQVDAEKSSLDMVIEKAAKRRAGGVYF